MKTLDLYKNRKHSVVKLRDGKEYKIPTEYTVEEVERLLELRTLQEEIEKEIIVPGSERAQIERMYEPVFEQLEIIFQRYQPGMTVSDLKKLVSHTDALDMLGFFSRYRDSLIMQEAGKVSAKAESKKKAKLASTELRDLRRIITFMVYYGFSLLEVKKLYIDEMYNYYGELLFTLEKAGKLKEGSYDKIKSKDNGYSLGATVDSLRKQMFTNIAKKR